MCVCVCVLSLSGRVSGRTVCVLAREGSPRRTAAPTNDGQSSNSNNRHLSRCGLPNGPDQSVPDKKCALCFSPLDLPQNHCYCIKYTVSPVFCRSYMN